MVCKQPIQGRTGLLSVKEENAWPNSVMVQIQHNGFDAYARPASAGTLHCYMTDQGDGEGSGIPFDLAINQGKQDFHLEMDESGVYTFSGKITNVHFPGSFLLRITGAIHYGD